MADPHVVLIVEDHDDVRDAVARLVSATGCTAVTAENGAEALSLLTAGLRPRLILLDIAMPVMDGFEFRAAQVTSPALAAIPTVVLTGLGGSVSAMKATLGVEAVLPKPLDSDAVMFAVERYC